MREHKLTAKRLLKSPAATHEALRELLDTSEVWPDGVGRRHNSCGISTEGSFFHGCVPVWWLKAPKRVLLGKYPPTSACRCGAIDVSCHCAHNCRPIYTDKGGQERQALT